jgi:GT2 family glycosyltransferase
LQEKTPDGGAAPEVSVIVVNWNRREMLRGCLESLLRQNGPVFEVIVVDNGSGDGSPEMAASFGARAGFPLHLIRNSRNLGFCAANNQGIRAARGRWVALLNNDAEAEPGWLQAMVRSAESHPGTGMVACKIVVYEDPTRIDKAGHLIWPDGQNRGRGTGEVDNGQYDREEEVLWPDGCAALYRKAMLDEIGGFDEDLFAYGDDAELGLRARIAGWKCVYTPAAVVRHRRGATLGVLSGRRLELIERNRVLLAVKHFPASLLWLNVPWFLARLAGGATAGLRGRGEAGRFAGAGAKLRMTAALVRGLAAGIAMIPGTWRKRRAMQPLRRLGPREVRQLVMQHRISLRALSEGAN